MELCTSDRQLDEVMNEGHGTCAEEGYDSEKVRIPAECGDAAAENDIIGSGDKVD